jgi:cytoskeletal protein RodZ
MEEGNFKTIPSVFDKGYLKLYAKALDMDTKPLLALYEQMKSGTAAPAIMLGTGSAH